MAGRRTRFVTWAKRVPDDETPIVYTFKAKEPTGEDRTYYFTSEDTVSFTMMERIRQAWIEKIDRVQNEFEDAWNVILYED